MNILFSCHKHPYYAFSGRPRGAEKSMQIIMRYLRNEGFNVSAYSKWCSQETIEGVQFEGYNLREQIKKADIVLTWGNAAPETASICTEENKPYILMIRWYRLIQPIPPGPGDLMTREIDQSFVNAHRYIFDNAKSVITNNHYAASVIKRYYGVDALVSYVPIEGDANNIANPNGYLTVVTPDKGLGEWQFINCILESMPREKIMVVNAEISRESILAQDKWGERLYNHPYTDDMTQVWSKTKILLLPVFDNDICGTTRVAIEAQQHGIPVIATDRCGISEKVDNLVAKCNKIEDWVYMINYVSDHYKGWSKGCIENFKQYNTPAQLQIFKNEILK